jgi:ribonuclease BN (tRNA processing enzyme)
MRLVVLGSGTGAPSRDRGPSGYWLEAGGARLRLDCGPGTVQAMARHALPWPSLTHQWVSHFHIDHALDLPALLFALKYGRGDFGAAAPAPRGPLTFIGPRGLRALMERVLAAFDSDLMVAQDFAVEVVEVEAGAEVDLGGGARLRTAKTPHTGESLAARIDAGGRAFGYTGDTAPSAELAAFFHGADVLVAECSFVDDTRGTHHLRADDTAALATAAAARHLVAVHAYFDPAAIDLRTRLARNFSGEITIAQDGTDLHF